MGVRSTEILQDSYYHIYNRGNNRQPIFLSRENYEFFLRKFRLYFSAETIQLVAYCLMPNHFHLLVHILRVFDFSKHMKSFSISYVKSFHSWYKTSGHFFEDDYRAKLIKEDGHLIQVVPYMHLNPVLAGLVHRPEEWEFSDCRLWLQDEGKFPGSEIRQQLYGNAEDYRKYLSEYATWKREIRELESRLLR